MNCKNDTCILQLGLACRCKTTHMYKPSLQSVIPLSADDCSNVIFAPPNVWSVERGRRVSPWPWNEAWRYRQSEYANPARSCLLRQRTREAPAKGFSQRTTAKVNFSLYPHNIFYILYIPNITRINFMYITFIIVIIYINFMYITTIIYIIYINFNQRHLNHIRHLHHLPELHLHDISPTTLLLQHSYIVICTGVITQEFWQRSCYKGAFRQELVVARELLHRTCFTGVITQELTSRRSSCIRKCLETATSQVLLNSFLRRQGQWTTCLRKVTLCGNLVRVGRATWGEMQVPKCRNGDCTLCGDRV